MNGFDSTCSRARSTRTGLSWFLRIHRAGYKPVSLHRAQGLRERLLRGATDPPAEVREAVSALLQALDDEQRGLLRPSRVRAARAAGVEDIASRQSSPSSSTSSLAADRWSSALKCFLTI